MKKMFPAIYAGSEKGLFMQYPVQKMPDGYDPRERPWYQEAPKAENGKQVITKTICSNFLQARWSSPLLKMKRWLRCYWT
ncbi:hypothetical protein ACEQPO_23470 [Bacillus sp. SL00103]